MPPEVKETAEVLSTLLGAGGLGAIVLAIIGVFSAKKNGASEKDKEKPQSTVGREGVAQIGALMLDGAVGRELTASIDRLTLAYERCTQARQDEMRLTREHGEDVRHLAEEIAVLARGMSRLKCS